MRSTECGSEARAVSDYGIATVDEPSERQSQDDYTDDGEAKRLHKRGSTATRGGSSVRTIACASVHE